MVMVHVPDNWSNKMSAELCREADARDADVSFDLLVVNREGLVEGQRDGGACMLGKNGCACQEYGRDKGCGGRLGQG